MADAAEPADVPGHDEYVCPGCAGLAAELVIAREVYECAAGRHCIAATPEQRIAFEAEITKRLDEWRRTHPETT